MRDKLAVSAGGPRSPWTIWVPSALGLVSSALLLAAYAAAGIMSTWDTPAPGRGWLGVGAGGQCGLAGSAWSRRACVNVVEMTPAALPSPVTLVYLITAVRALAQFHQPVPRHRPEDGSYQR